MVTTATFDTADYLTDEETIAEYLTAALEDPSPDVFLAAVRDLARPVAWRNSPQMWVWAVRASIKRSPPVRSHAMTRCSSMLHALGVKISATPVHP